MRRFGESTGAVTRRKAADHIIPSTSADVLKKLAEFISDKTPFTIRNNADSEGCSFRQRESMHAVVKSIRYTGDGIFLRFHGFSHVDSSIMRLMVFCTILWFS